MSTQHRSPSKCGRVKTQASRTPTLPYFYDTDGFFSTYDPVSDRYTSSLDSAAGVYQIYDLATDTFYTYDPVSGT